MNVQTAQLLAVRPVLQSRSVPLTVQVVTLLQAVVLTAFIFH
jgi:hypothetical protein